MQALNILRISGKGILYHYIKTLIWRYTSNRVIMETRIAEELLKWFKKHGRCFTFRWQDDPYRLLVAGILLRQTQAIQVASVYPRLIDMYPTIKSMANSDEETLKTIIKPLGITSRANTLIKLSNQILKEHNGIVPNSYGELVSLPGIGDYIASCILTMGFKQSRPMIDVNVNRVLRRLYGGDIDIQYIYNILCPKGNEEAFHYALLDLAQIVCRSSKPKCNLCPIRKFCNYYIALK